MWYKLPVCFFLGGGVDKLEIPHLTSHSWEWKSGVFFFFFFLVYLRQAGNGGASDAGGTAENVPVTRSLAQQQTPSKRARTDE
jgi:hypothetical protein